MLGGIVFQLGKELNKSHSSIFLSDPSQYFQVSLQFSPSASSSTSCVMLNTPRSALGRSEERQPEK